MVVSCFPEAILLVLLAAKERIFFRSPLYNVTDLSVEQSHMLSNSEFLKIVFFVIDYGENYFLFVVIMAASLYLTLGLNKLGISLLN